MPLYCLQSKECSLPSLEVSLRSYGKPVFCALCIPFFGGDLGLGFQGLCCLLFMPSVDLVFAVQ